MDLGSCIYNLPKPISSFPQISLSHLSCQYYKKSFLTLNAKEQLNLFASKSFQLRRTKIVNHSKRQEVDNSNTQNDSDQDNEWEQVSGEDKLSGVVKLIGLVIPVPGRDKENNENNLGIIAACAVGLFTGIGVVLFNYVVHEIRYTFWDGVFPRGASWLREKPIQDTWKQIIFVPVCGGVIVSVLNRLGAFLELDAPFPPGIPFSNVRAASRSFLKALAASFTLGTGNSLGPEGPSVEIGASIARGVSNFFATGVGTRLSLIAAGSAAGFSSGFNAAVAGCFFAVESVLRSSSVESSPSLTNTTSMVILSAVIAAIVSQVGLGSEPAFKVPEYDFRSPTELPLYLLLGIICGLVSLSLTRCTSYALTVVDTVHKEKAVPKYLFPVLGGFIVGVIALAYPEILYRGFENVDILLESQPSMNTLPAVLLLQLVGVKILATSVCRASGLVGGYYAPSLFIGAATGMAYGKLISSAISLSDPMFHLSLLEVASPQAYGLVGMAATLAGVCQVPLTAVLLLFELTQDYRIVLPLLGAVGLSSLIASGQEREKDVEVKTKSSGSKSYDSDEDYSNSNDLCELESSLCLDESFTELKNMKDTVSVSQAMQTRYLTVLMNTLLTEAVALMLAEKQSCAFIVDDHNFLIGFVTLGDIEEFCKFIVATRSVAKEGKPLVSDIYHMNRKRGRLLRTVTPDMNLLSVRNFMTRQGLQQLPVVSEHVKDQGGYPVGLLNRDSIDLAFRALATQDCLSDL